jgi:hypothetical protein
VKGNIEVSRTSGMGENSGSLLDEEEEQPASLNNLMAGRPSLN